MRSLSKNSFLGCSRSVQLPGYITCDVRVRSEPDTIVRLDESDQFREHYDVASATDVLGMHGKDWSLD